MLHVDVDPRKGEDLAKEQARALKVLEDFSPSPSAIIFSGGGYQGFWKLDDPLFVGGDQTRVAEYEAYNRQLEIVLGGDHCWNIDRIMRIPGTVNVPDQKKRDRGRVETLATIVSLSEATYPLDSFTAAPWKRSNVSAGKDEVSLPEDLPSLDVSALRLPPAMLALMSTGEHPDAPGRYPSRSEPSWAITCEMVRAGYDDATIGAILLDPDLPIADHTRERGRAYVARQIGRARDAEDAGGRRVLDPNDPYRTARRLKDELLPDAIHTNDDWLAWREGAYRDVEDDTVKSMLWSELDASFVRVKRDDSFEFERLKPSRTRVGEVLAAMQGLAHRPVSSVVPPVWLDGQGPSPFEIVACRNGLLHVPSGELLPATPRFFTRQALDIDFEPDAPVPTEWLRFVDQVFSDKQAVELLQDWFGYLLLPDVSQQKILLMVGPTRSGKGVTQRVITQLVGAGNTCNPKSGSLGSGNVGTLQPLIGKTVAFISDARFGGRSDKHAITETLLTISGGDPVTIDRKHKEAWSGMLPTRFVMLSNELPSLKDNSPALANRFIPLIFRESFLGREDHGLADRIVGSELPGVLNWALDGWRRLRERGRFVMPDVSRDAISEILELGSPAAHFLRDLCVVEPGRQIEKPILFEAYVTWCRKNEMHYGDLSHFARDIIAASNNQVRSKRGSVGGRRVNQFEGVDLLPLPPSPY